MTNNVVWQRSDITRQSRNELKGHDSFALWLTGLSGSGKSTLANALENMLYDQGVHTYILDGDNIRHGINKDLGFSAADRSENIRRVGEVSKLFVDAGIVAITALISPFREDRERAFAVFNNKRDIIEIYVKCSLDECENRDPKGLYEKARKGEIKEFTGISSPYEEPLHPDIVVSTDQQTVEQSVEQIMAYLRGKQYLEVAKEAQYVEA